MDDQPKSIRALFHEAERAREKLSTFTSANTPEYQSALRDALATYEACLQQSNQVSLFSPNESLDDVSSGDLQYMAINYQLAELGQKITGDTSARKQNLLQARTYYERFLKLLDSYDMLSKADSRLFETYAEDKANFSTAPKDAALRRDAKISRFKQEKELKQKLQYLNANPRLEEEDEQAVRGVHLTNLALMVHQTFASLESIAQELHILSLAPAAPLQQQGGLALDSREKDRNEDGYSERLDGQLAGLRLNSGPILDSSGKPLRPFTLLDTRQNLKKNVFRPDHSLPTMTIDEYLEEEKRRGGIIEGGGEQSGIRQEVDEDDLDKADEETLKARAWDEFKEDNPKGSGNTINRG